MSDSSEVEQSTPAQSIFFQQLHSMVHTESHTGAVAWLPDGKGFVILRKQYFSDKILPLYFGRSKYTSFTRRLMRWGFRRGDRAGVYCHDLFTRDMRFDLDQDLGSEHSAISRNNSSASLGTLPIKKRTKWMTESNSAVEGHICVSKCELSSVTKDDVRVLPELMRTIGRQKRRVERGSAASSSPSKRLASHPDGNIEKTIASYESVQAAQTLASLGRQTSLAPHVPSRRQESM